MWARTWPVRAFFLLLESSHAGDGVFELKDEGAIYLARKNNVLFVLDCFETDSRKDGETRRREGKGAVQTSEGKAHGGAIQDGYTKSMNRRFDSR